MLEIIGFLVLVVIMLYVTAMCFFLNVDTFSEGLLSRGGFYTLAGILTICATVYGWSMLFSSITVSLV